ncbi:HpcH/HpaI aldolase family protein [Streptomyces sp. HUAS TT7]|uniref:HpcH/HpaI aldolase family protein n=1 Tax=Streptomyces sp. HUAS TT7 TaxID=3447507 RepID=UPI003F660BBD
MTDLRRRLAAGHTLYGTFLGLGSALATEACALAGFDWLLVDLEHGGGDESTVIHQQLTAEAHHVPLLVRVESADRIRAGRVLDMGATGVMFPRLGTPAQVHQAVRHLRYPPLGDRGVSAHNRAYGFGARAQDFDTAHQRILSVVQIESRQALESIEDIVALDGIDVLFVGPRDLSYDLGVPGDTAAPVFQDALARILAAAESAGLAAGILAPDARAARQYAAEGFRFIGIGSDSAMLLQAGRAALDLVHASSPTESTSGLPS